MNKILPVLIILPIALEVIKISGKPVFIVLSDLYFILFPIAMFIGKQNVENNSLSIDTIKLFKIVLFSLVVIIGIGILGAIKLGGDIIPFISSIRLMKNHLFFIFGAYLALNMKTEDLLIICRRASLFFVVTMVFSDIIWGDFPSPRLGGLFFNMEVYGFPNSPAVFYTVFLAFLVNGLIYSRGKLFKIIYGTGSMILLVYIIGTLSRAGMLNVFLFMVLMSLFGGKGYKPILIISVLFLFVLISYLLLNNPELMVGLEGKFNKFDANEDESNGRYDIWVHALDIFSQSPIWGLTFEPFSNYGAHDTPHNQYIELLYKVGFLGFFAYLSPLIYSFIKLTIFRPESLNINLRELRLISLGVTASILITNNVQPNLSYTPTGVFLYFLLGFTLCKITQSHNHTITQIEIIK